DLRVLLVSRSAGTAGSFLFEMWQHVASNAKIRAIWGDGLVGRPWNDEMFTLGSRRKILREPTVTALGASGAVISRHYDLIVADDVVTFETARTMGQRDKLVEWWGTALLPTLEPTGELVVVGTRYHPDDLYQHLIESGNYVVLRQAALWNEKAGRVAQPGDDDGDLVSLWPELWPVEVLIEKRKEVGSARFQAQYQNDVEAMVGGLFDRAWFRSVAAEPGDRKLVTYVGVDLAISQRATADYFAWAVIKKDVVDGNVYVVAMGRDRLTFDQQVQRIVTLNKVFRPRRIGIEDVAYQQALVQHLQAHASVVPVRGVKRRGVDKVTRAMMRLQPLAENGKLLFVGESEVFDACWQEMVALHTGEGHDDLFDALDTAVEVSEVSEPRVWLL
ncbi:MAG: phage terminase large subunit, partial [Mariprofundales bacterium]|nr:phage terminase large subunit [Mariprofundales bacterium]